MPPHCFRAGTRIVTLRGEVPVEDVAVGDLVLTLSGEGAPLKPVVWTGRVTVDLARHPDPLAVRPVRMAAGTVEPGMPVRDLVVSPDHGIALEDDRGRRVLVAAHWLVNGATITREPAVEVVAYHHVEVAGHEILMADGMAAESFHPDADRAVFGGNVVALDRRAVRAVDFRPVARAGRSVAPVLLGAEAAALHRRLLGVAEGLGFALTGDAGLAVEGAETIADGEGEYVFLLPAGAGPVMLRSRTFVPAETEPGSGDQRVLGVALARVVLDGVEIDLAGAAFGAGFLPCEGEPGGWWRWSTGEAWLDLPARSGESTLEVRVRRGWGRYWLPPTPR